MGKNADGVRLGRVGALVGLLLCSFAACDGDQASYAHDARRYDASLPDAIMLDAIMLDAIMLDAGPPVGCDWSTYTGDVLVQSSAELAALEGYTYIDGALRIKGCEDCVDLTALNCLTEVSGAMGLGCGSASWGGIHIVDNPHLEDMTGLGNLQQVHGPLNVSGNPSLTSLDGLDSLTAVGGFGVSSNESLVSLQGMDHLASAGALEVSGNDVLEDLTGLESLSVVGGWNPRVQIYMNPSLSSLEGLGSITSLGELRVERNASLTSLAGLESLAAAEFSVIEHNAVLLDCEVCALLARLGEPPEGLSVADNLADSCTPVPDNCP